MKGTKPKTRGKDAQSCDAHPGDEFAELKAVLSADYSSARFLPSPEQVRDLKGVIDTRIRSNRYFRDSRLGSCNFRESAGFSQSDQIVVQGRPYNSGSGLLLWGFSCDLRDTNAGKFVIVLNTAHHPAAVAGTLLHEFGHYLYRSQSDLPLTLPARMQPTFAAHLSQPEELYSDCVVALSIYDGECEAVHRTLEEAGSSACLPDLIRRADAVVDPFYHIDLERSKISAPWRVRYLTYKVHLYKLRKALLDTAGI